MKLKTSSLLFLLSICFSIPLKSQITIGSDFEPNNGALLDLKEKMAIGPFFEDSNKGLGLPRVSLSNMNQLFPMFAQPDGVTPTPDYNANKTQIDQAHTGLLIYNVNEDVCATIPINRGIHVWDGIQWQALLPLAENYETYQDQDGNDFKAASFGTAGIWMVENLRAKKYADGSLMDPASPITSAINQTDKFWAYPGPRPAPNPLPQGATGATNGTDPYYVNQQPAIGLIYTWGAATKGENTYLTDQGQVEGSVPGPNEVENTGTKGTAPHKYIQGICPNGWHLPSDREWNELEKEIATHASKYGTLYSDSEISWDPAWETANKVFRPDGTYPSVKSYGTIMKSACPPISGNTIYKPNGFSKRAEQGGFGAILSNYAFSGSLLSYYGTRSSFWTSSSSTSTTAWGRYVINTNAGMYRYDNQTRYSLMSVRCKKN